jgi:hypothetical protein
MPAGKGYGLAKGKMHQKKKSMKKKTMTMHGRLHRAKRKVREAVFGKEELKDKKKNHRGSNYISPKAYESQLEEASRRN